MRQFRAGYHPVPWKKCPAKLAKKVLNEATVAAHSALFDVGFLPTLRFEPGKVADTMILSQLLHVGSKVEPEEHPISAEVGESVDIWR